MLCREKEQIEKCRILTQEVKTEREEKRKLKSDVEHLKKQFYHESKRTEKEITRLKEKIHLVSIFFLNIYSNITQLYIDTDFMLFLEWRSIMPTS